jgi:hypothetical protein
MENINIHSGINIGGVTPVQWIYQNDIGSITFSLATLIAGVTLKSGKAWNNLYGSPGTINIESDPKDSDAGMVHTYKIKMLVPKNRIDAEQQLFQMDGRKIVVKVKDKNGTVRLFGTTDAAFTKTHKLLMPGEVPGFNGYEVIFLGDLTHPALFIPSEDGITGM